MNTNRLLVIDDEPGICEFITEVAEGGFKVRDLLKQNLACMFFLIKTKI